MVIAFAADDQSTHGHSHQLLASCSTTAKQKHLPPHNRFFAAL
jgi:hypothetical protein